MYFISHKNIEGKHLNFYTWVKKNLAFQFTLLVGQKLETGPVSMCPVHSPDFSEKPAVSADQAAGPRQRPHPITRGLSQQEPPASQQSLTYAGEREEVTRHILN